MATHRHVVVRVSGTERLADLTGIIRDLDATIEIANEYLAAREQPRNGVLIDALTTAAIIRYNRSFASGRRSTARDVAKRIFNATEKQKHENFRVWRDKHIAHSVNSFEENIVVAWLNPEERGKLVNSVATQGHLVFGMSLDDARDLIGLSKKLKSELAVEFDSEQNTLLKRLRQLPVDEVYGW